MNLDLTDAEAEALTQELARIIDSARYPLSPRIRTLKAVLDKLRPEPVREPCPRRRQRWRRPVRSNPPGSADPMQHLSSPNGLAELLALEMEMRLCDETLNVGFEPGNFVDSGASAGTSTRENEGNSGYYGPIP